MDLSNKWFNFWYKVFHPHIIASDDCLPRVENHSLILCRVFILRRQRQFCFWRASEDCLHQRRSPEGFDAGGEGRKRAYAGTNGTRLLRPIERMPPEARLFGARFSKVCVEALLGQAAVATPPSMGPVLRGQKRRRAA